MGREARSRLLRGILLFPGLLLLAFPLASQAEIPPRPGPGEFLHDLAGIIDAADETAIRELQQSTFEQAQVPIVVVTVTRMREYDPGSPSIESFARRWFDTWGIGTQQKNDGILVLVSSGDRRGRIELGGAWARRFDGYAQRIMDHDMIPRFKANDYGGGLVAAVERLSAMAIAGPQSEPPPPELSDQIRDNPAVQFATQNNPITRRLGPIAPILMVLAGLGCFVAAYFMPEHRKFLIIAGVVLVALAVIFWIVIIILAVLGRSRSGGGGGGGGGFGGGSSGGGGASGSW